MTSEVLLRAVTEADLAVFFQQQEDPEANAMAAFPARAREAFMAHWTRILADASVATRALRDFLAQVPTRPLYAHVARHNVASIRVLEKCGFTVCGEDRAAPSTGGEEVDELIFRLASPSPARRRTVSPEPAMADAPAYPYETRLNIQYGPLELIDVQQLADTCTHPWYNQTLCQVNDSMVRVGVVQGEYHWHKHTGEDEFFYVVEGRFLIDLEDRTVELLPRQGFVVPRGVRHRPRAPERTIILMVEGSGIVPTGS